MAAAIARAPRACAERLASAPWKTPIGVRTALKITTSSMTSPVKHSGGVAGRWRGLRTGTEILAHDFPAHRSRPPTTVQCAWTLATTDHALSGHRFRRETDRAGDLRSGRAARRAAQPPWSGATTARPCGRSPRSRARRRSSGWSSASRWTSTASAARSPGGSARFGARLAEMTGLPVEWVDEALTSAEAAERLRQAGSRHPARAGADRRGRRPDPAAGRPGPGRPELTARTDQARRRGGTSAKGKKAGRGKSGGGRKVGIGLGILLLLLMVPAGLAAWSWLKLQRPYKGYAGTAKTVADRARHRGGPDPPEPRARRGCSPTPSSPAPT